MIGFHKLKYLFFVPLLTSCTIASYQADCEKNFNAFPNVVSCLKEKLNNDPRVPFHRDSDLANLYILAAEKLAYQVRIGRISDIDARYDLAQIYVLLKSETRQRNNADFNEMLDAMLVKKAIQKSSHPSYVCTNTGGITSYCNPR